MTDLEPCPFCGGTPDLDDYRDKPAAAWVLVHRSRTCPIAPIIQSFSTGEKAVAAWNPRAPSPAARERDAMREALTLSLAWHEEHEKSLSKQPPGGSRDWQRMKHQEEIARLRSALNTGEQS